MTLACCLSNNTFLESEFQEVNGAEKSCQPCIRGTAGTHVVTSVLSPRNLANRWHFVTCLMQNSLNRTWWQHATTTRLMHSIGPNPIIFLVYKFSIQDAPMTFFFRGPVSSMLCPAMIEVTEVSLWEIFLFHTGIITDNKYAVCSNAEAKRIQRFPNGAYIQRAAAKIETWTIRAWKSGQCHAAAAGHHGVFEEDLWWNSTLNTRRGKKNGHWGEKYWGYCFTFSDLALGTSMDHALQHQHLGNAAGGVTEPLGLSVVWGRIMIHIQQRGPQLFVQIIYTWTNWTGWFL